MAGCWRFISVQTERVITSFIVTVSGELFELLVHVDPESGQQISADDELVVVHVYYDAQYSFCGLDGPGASVDLDVQ